jgi:toxin ParE1/3/4
LAIEQALHPLLQMPLMGSQREYLGVGLRVIFHSPYAIYYLPTETEVVIVRVLHGARDVVAIANQGGLVE